MPSSWASSASDGALAVSSAADGTATVDMLGKRVEIGAHGLPSQLLVTTDQVGAPALAMVARPPFHMLGRANRGGFAGSSVCALP